MGPMGWDVVIAVVATLVATAVVPPWVEAIKGRRRREDAAKAARLAAARELLAAAHERDTDRLGAAGVEVVLLSTPDEAEVRQMALSAAAFEPWQMVEKLATWVAADIRTPRRARRSARTRQSRARS